jgi:16S rRNA (cytidine1402-2'-O)-methyltransferase
MVLAREVSKIHEEFLRGPVSEICRQIGDRDVLGELTLVIAGWDGQSTVSPTELKQEIERLRAEGARIKEIADLLGEKYAYSKKEIYRMVLDQQKSAKQ